MKLYFVGDNRFCEFNGVDIDRRFPEKILFRMNSKTLGCFTNETKEESKRVYDYIVRKIINSQHDIVMIYEKSINELLRKEE